MKVIKKVVSLNLEEKLIEKIDKKRNGVPRSHYVNELLTESEKLK